MSVEVATMKKPGRLPALDENRSITNMQNGKKSLFTKKARPNTGEIELMASQKGENGSPTGPRTAATPAPNQLKRKRTAFVNRKNVSQGLIYLNIKDDDKVNEEVNLDVRDNFMEILDQNPQRTTSFMENLKTGDFYQIYNTAVVNLRAEKKVSQPTTFEHIEVELANIVVDYDDFFRKSFVFFQGLLAGLSILHLYLVNFESDDQQNLMSYGRFALRLNQIFHIISLLSCTGALIELLKYYRLYNESRRKQSEDLIERRKIYNIYVVAFILYFICYGVVIFLHEFSAIVSNKIYEINNNDLSSVKGRTVLWKVLNYALTVAAFFAWLLIVKNSYSQSSDQAEELLDDDARTSDEMSNE
jgi:hypothetical protein